MQLSLILTSLFTLTAQAVPTERLQKRDTICGSTRYSTTSVNMAANVACHHLRARTNVGGFPHRYYNNEGFKFTGSGPWYEFPLKTNTFYSGGYSGPDRVVINGACQQVGHITHTGASGNAFRGCSGTYQ
ncbi:guanyl-specific ribonuclease F1 [Colletotrichum eremochloae]|nr:guanyl-specific ribonuclease F1 [Colletotrichum eremochloae]